PGFLGLEVRVADRVALAGWVQPFTRTVGRPSASRNLTTLTSCGCAVHRVIGSSSDRIIVDYAIAQQPNYPMELIGLGCMRLSTERDRDEASAVEVLHAALDAGVTLLDTADAYCWDEPDSGHNERLI